MNIMSNDDKAIIKNTLNSIYDVTGIKSNLSKTNDVNKNTYTISTIDTNTTANNQIEISSLITDYCKYDIKLLNEYIDNIVNQKGVENKMISKIEVKGKDKNIIIVHFEDGDIQKSCLLAK